MDEINDNENWFYKRWRPGMAYLYMAICAFDFIIGPVIFYSLQDLSHPVTQWIPMTLRAGGLFHVAMGTIIGVTAWSRGQEKIKYMEYFVSSTPSESVKEIDADPVAKEPLTK